MFPYHDSSHIGKLKATRAEKIIEKLKLKNKKKKSKKKKPCPTCGQTISDTPASRWQHRSRNRICRMD